MIYCTVSTNCILQKGASRPSCSMPPALQEAVPVPLANGEGLLQAIKDIHWDIYCPQHSLMGCNKKYGGHLTLSHQQINLWVHLIVGFHFLLPTI